MTKRAVLVARVSGKKQEGNYSLPTQLEAMRSYALQHGLTVSEEIQDVISGTVEIQNRPGGARLYALIGKRKVDAVIFYTIDRVARDEDVAEFVILKRDLRRIFALYVGDDPARPMSHKAIAQLLGAEGVRPPGRGDKDTPRGWYEGTIKRILQNPAYCGRFRYNGHTIHLPELALIDCETFERAQDRTKRNKQLARRNRKYEYLLSGHIFCSCGSTMPGGKTTAEGKPYYYYRCRRQTHLTHLPECHALRVRADIADRVVWDWLAELMADDQQLRRGLRRMAEQDALENQPKRERLATVRELVAETETSIKGLVGDLAALKDAGDLARETIREAIKHKSNLLRSLTEERNRLEAELERLELTPELEARILDNAAKLRAGMSKANYETKRFFLDRLDLRAKLRVDATGRWLDVTCGLTVEAEALPIDNRHACAKKAPR